MKVANPQGKGNSLITNHWHPVISAQRKPLAHIMRDYFDSSLVLRASFNFKPVVAHPYYLYLWNGELRLSLIEPEKLDRDSAAFIARCQLKADLTWKTQLAERNERSPEVNELLENHYQGFYRHLDQDTGLTDILPTYIAELGYYPRLYSSAMSKSLSISLEHGQQCKLKAKDLLAQLPKALLLE